MVEKGMRRINEYFVNTYDMSEDTQSTYKLMRVTVYCFLAEFHSLNHNEFFRKTFSLPAIDKKESSNIFHFEKVVNY
uniref:Predicted protein n=1 Tax=Hordeum vulgare subsp. vulgare TaxID=112509 RepID=F2DZN4_HORVV|nr:predicted protein [Hordeum vulgare subsp. vulgare]